MTTVEFEKHLDLQKMNVIDTSKYTQEELRTIAHMGRIVRNIEMLKGLLGPLAQRSVQSAHNR